MPVPAIRVYLPAGSCIRKQPPTALAWYDRVFLTLQTYPGPELTLDLDTPRVFKLPSREARIVAASEIMLYLRTVPDARRRVICAELEARVRMPEQELTGRMLSWEQIRKMQEVGISFGSHTMSHAVVSRLPEAEAERELVESKHLLEEKLQAAVEDFAFPFGQPADWRLKRRFRYVLAGVGYRSAVTTVWRASMPLAPIHYSLRRTQIGENRHLPMFVLRLNELFIRAGKRNAADIWADSSLDSQGKPSLSSNPLVSSR